MKKCPYCAEVIQDDAVVCRFCGKELKPRTAPVQPVKKHNNAVPLFMLAVIIIGIIWICSRSTSGGRRPSYSPPEAKTYTITYKVTGTARKVSLTYENKTGDTEQKDAPVPWEYKFTTAEESPFLYVSAQNDGETGTVKCEILADGVSLAKAESSGAYKISTCSWP